MNPPDDLAQPDAQAVQLAELIARLTNDLRNDGAVDVDKLAQEYPDMADELRDLWSVAWIAEEVARSSGWSRAAGETTDWGVSRPVKKAHFDPGESFGGCELLEELGRGGMGVVYRALQPGLGRIVALKRLLHGGSALPNDVARFRAEAESAARLDHPHIVPVYSVDEDIRTSEHFFLMRYVDGTTLAKLLAEGPLPAHRAATLLAPVARAIHYAHQRGVLHRDLKPSNILIDVSGLPHVSDFGLAKRVDADASLTQSGAILGTPSYMAPEQAAPGRGTAIGPACDVYGLGAILYQMLTGRPPFQAASPLDTILLVLEQDPIPPRMLNPKANADLEMVALKCLQKSAELRYASALSLACDLDAFLLGEPVSARSTSLRALAMRLLGETQHASIMENWGALWICHSAALMVLFGIVNGFLWYGIKDRWPYVMIFTLGLGVWAAIFWAMRRRGGPISFVERQLAHVWGAGTISINLVFLVEWLLGMPVLTLAPVLAISNGMLFMIKGGILSGVFYVYAGLVFLAIFPMVWFPRFGPLIFASTSAVGFFATGLQAILRRGRSKRTSAASDGSAIPTLIGPRAPRDRSLGQGD